MRGGGKFKKVLANLAAQTASQAIARAGIVSSSATYPDGTKVAQVAAWNEFGTERIPPRPFFRQTISENSSKWRDQATHLLKANHYNVKLTLGQMGEVMRGDLVQTISTFSEPPNAASTVAKKGFNAPLRNTGVLLQSIGSDVVDK